MRINDITESEKYVMKCIWDSKDDLSMQQITELVNTHYGKTWKTQTVSTFLARLVKKEYLNMYRRGRCFFYHPLVEKEVYKDQLLQDYVKFWYNGKMSNFVVNILEKDFMDASERDALKKKIEGLN